MPTRRNGSQSNVIAQHLFAASLMLMPITVCWGQQCGGVDREVATPLIMSVLSEAKLSGSLEYWGRCDNVSGIPDYPRLRAPRNDAGTPLQTLREMFADDVEMQVTQEPDGTIRMGEADVPRDLLDVPISHISFDGGTKRTKQLPDGPEKIEPWIVDDPNDALGFVLAAPEVRTSMENQNVEPLHRLEALGLRGIDLRRISGDLDNVTLSQALDHLLKTFPGLWIYENCPSKKRNRFVYFRLYSNNAAWAALARRGTTGVPRLR
jgi:hypothetical protein